MHRVWARLRDCRDGTSTCCSSAPGGGASDELKDSRRLILVIVFMALLLDNILLTVVVPIIPDYLWTLEHADEITRYTDNYLNDTLLNNTAYNNSETFYNNNITEDLTGAAIFNHTSYGGDVVRQPELGVAGPIAADTVISENSEVGWLFSSKAIVQLICNPFIGPITNRYGSSVPMFVGIMILGLSNTLYAFGESYALLFVARAVQGIGSACIAISGMTVLAIAYPDDTDRSRAMGIALGGISLGVLIGYPFGGFMYQFTGKTLPFLLLAILTLLVAAIQVWALQPSIKTKDFVEGTPLHILLCDPYILAASGAILFPEMAMAMLEPTLPIWLLDKMHAAKWQLGTVFLPDSIGYLLGTIVFAFVAHKIGRWICTGVALLLMGICLMCIPLATHVPHLIAPNFGLGLSLGMVDVAIMPMLAYLVDKRHVAAYGSVYAIAQVSISLGFAVGPSLGGQIVRLIGFPWLIRGMAMANLIYCPIAYFLRDPPSREENKSILMSDNRTPGYMDEEENFNYHKLCDE